MSITFAVLSKILLNRWLGISTNASRSCANTNVIIRSHVRLPQYFPRYDAYFTVDNENHLKPHISASDAAVTDKIHSNGRPNSKSEPALLLDSTINGSKERMSAARPKITPEVLRNQILVELSPKNSLRIPKYSRRKSTERTEVQEISNGAQMSKKRSSWRVWIKFSHRDPESKKSNGPSSPSSGHLQPPSIHVSDHIGLDKVKEKQNESRMRVQSDTGLFQKNLLD